MLNNETMNNENSVSPTIRIIAGLVAGLIGGIVSGLLVPPEPGLGVHIVISIALGLIFGLAFGPKIQTAGAGLVWGAAFGVFWWLTGTLTLLSVVSGEGVRWTATAAQELFPFLLANVLSFGGALGLSYYPLINLLRKINHREAELSVDPPKSRIPTGKTVVLPLIQTIIIGAIGGLIGSWVFAWGIEREVFYPLVAGLVRSESMMVGTIVHYTIGLIIGITFGILFNRDIRGVGSGIIWGLTYGLIWWMIGPLTLTSWIGGAGFQPNWSLSAAQTAFTSLIAHVLYGAMVGLFYTTVSKIWRALFIDSDPINRSLEGVGTRGLRSVVMGQAGGILGGILFGFIFFGIGALPRVATLVGAQSAFAGFIVHMVISIIVGSTYGLFFQREALSYGSGMAWGLLYGMLWWFIGSNTLFNIILRLPVDWTLETVVLRYPLLIGHLIYGAGLGIYFQALARTHDIGLSGRTRWGIMGIEPQIYRASGTPASALWAVAITLGVILPLLLQSGSGGIGY